MDIVEALKATKALIDTPKKWTKGALARAESGEPIYTDDPEAVCFCLHGAVNRVSGHQEHLRRGAKDKIALAIDTMYPGYGIAEFNDSSETTHEMMLELLDKAIDAAEGTR